MKTKILDWLERLAIIVFGVMIAILAAGVLLLVLLWHSIAEVMS